MRLYVAFRSDTETVTKMASGSFTVLKKRMKEEGEGAEFTVALFDFKPNLENLCHAVEDVTEIGAERSFGTVEYKITNGQLREVK